MQTFQAIRTRRTKSLGEFHTHSLLLSFWAAKSERNSIISSRFEHTCDPNPERFLTQIIIHYYFFFNWCCTSPPLNAGETFGAGGLNVNVSLDRNVTAVTWLHQCNITYCHVTFVKLWPRSMLLHQECYFHEVIRECWCPPALSRLFIFSFY